MNGISDFEIKDVSASLAPLVIIFWQFEDEIRDLDYQHFLGELQARHLNQIF